MRAAVGLAVGVAVGWNIANVGAVAEPLAAAYGVSLAAVGALTTALFVGHFAVQVPAGRRVDRLGARRVALVALLVIGTANALAAVSPELGLGLAARVLAGLGTGAGFVAGADYLRAASPSPLLQGLFGGAGIAGGGSPSPSSRTSTRSAGAPPT